MNRDIEIEGGRRHNRCRVNCRPKWLGPLSGELRPLRENGFFYKSCRDNIFYFLFLGMHLVKDPISPLIAPSFSAELLNPAFWFPGLELVREIWIEFWAVK